MNQPARILVRGSGDVASAVAHLLFGAGYAICMHESTQPGATRRGMAITDAIFDGSAVLEGVRAQRVDEIDNLKPLLAAGELIPVTTLALALVLEKMRPDVLVDARMKKHVQPEAQIGLAPLSIGLGPNFNAGENVHLAVETARGENLGRVIQHGPTQALEGEPNEIDGHGRDRYVYAPREGVFHTRLQIGARVSMGQEIARIETTALLAPIDGVLRGLTHDGVPVTLKAKVIEVDPRVEHAQISGIAERPARIAQGVLEAIRDWEQKQAGDS